ncbi:MAG: FGGY-family carbohydrate kinase [Propioniciclava sp.]
MNYVIGVDTGTTGVKAKIYDLTGRIIGQAYREYGCVYPQPGWVDQDIAMLTRANDAVLAEVIATSGVNPADIKSVGISTQRCLHLYADAAGTILRDGMGISWQDARTGAEVEWMRETIGTGAYYDSVGMPPSVVWTAPKIRWMQQHEPEVYAQTAKIITTQEWFLRELGAKDGWYEDYSNASLFGLMNIRTFEWDDELLSTFGVDRDLLPDLVPSGVQVGVVDAAASARTGLAVGTPICTGGGDQQCAAVGAGVISTGLAEVTLGTAGVSIAHLDEPRFDPNHRINCSASAIAGSKKWISEGLQAAAASSYRWFRDAIGYAGNQVQALGGGDAYDILNGLAGSAPAGAQGLLYLPYLAGSVAPNFDSDAKGAFLGLTFAHGTADMARAVMEGVSFETRDILESFAAMGTPLDEIRLSGGATKSPLWCQIQTDIYQRPTVALEEGECTVLGAALLGAMGAGVFTSMEEGVEQMVRVQATFEPNAALADRYDQEFGLFRDAYRALADGGVFGGLAQFQTDHSAALG